MNKKTLREWVAFVGKPFCIFALSHNYTEYLLFICNYAASIITSYFLFDSCWRSSGRIIDSPFGFSVFTLICRLKISENKQKELINNMSHFIPSHDNNS